MKKLRSILFPFNAAEAVLTAVILMAFYTLMDDKASFFFGLAVSYAVMVLAAMSGVEPRYRLIRVKHTK